MATKIRRTVCVRSFTTTQGKTLTPGARRQMERFYCQIDWDLGEEERELRRKAKKARRKAKRRIRRLLKMIAREASDATGASLPKTAFRDEMGGTRSSRPKPGNRSNGQERAK